MKVRVFSFSKYVKLITLDFTMNNNVDLKGLLLSKECRMPFLIGSRLEPPLILFKF